MINKKICGSFILSLIYLSNSWSVPLNLEPLKTNNTVSNPDPNFNYAQAFTSLDLNLVVDDLKKLMTTSQSWWPADYGNYGPFFIRMAWHSAGTYRIFDGRGGADGGMQRFYPLDSWPDNTNLDKARRLLWPIKQKYGDKISWGDLMILAGTVAIDSMGLKTIGFAGGRQDAWTAQYVNWGNEKKWLASERHNAQGQLKQPYGATQMGLIYVNPEGPNGKPDPLSAAKDIRETFKRMAMNDEETVALIAGGHAFGKAHGAANASQYLGPNPHSSPITEQGLGWKNSYKSGKGPDTITSGLEGAWTSTPFKWSHIYLMNLFQYDWEQTKSPAGATQWKPKAQNTENLIPDAYDPNIKHAPMMFTTDLALKYDPAYKEISQRFLKNPQELEMAFAKAWFKLTHRDMGPRSRYLGSMVPQETFIWQDPIPPINYQLVNHDDINQLKMKILNSKLSVSELVRVAWASASTFRNTDKRGGANGARIALLPQRNWSVNDPYELNKVLSTLEKIQQEFNTETKKISMADLIVLAGSAAIEEAAKRGGVEIQVPFYPGRNDALQKDTDQDSFMVLKPNADGFRNYYDTSLNMDTPEQMLVEKSSMLNLSIPEMTALVGGMRVLNTNVNQSSYGVLTNKPGTLNNDFFINLLDNSITWQESKVQPGTFEGYQNGKIKWKASRVDLIFGSHPELRALAEYYGASDGHKKLIKDFVKAWVKVMNLDRYDLKDKI